MAFAIGSSLLSRRFWEHKSSPVGDAANNSAGGEDNVAGGLGNSAHSQMKLLVSRVERRRTL